MGLPRRWSRERRSKHETSVEAYKESKKKGLGFEQPTTRGTSRDGHAFLNIQNKLIDIKYIPKEVEKRAYNDILTDDISLKDYVLHELSIHLIDLPLTHLELIDWVQPSILHVDEFPTKEVLFRFMGVETQHKQPRTPSTYVCKIDLKGYFGDNPSSSWEEVNKNKKKEKATKKVL